MIKKGDLVMVVGPKKCCGSHSNVGFVFKSSGIFKECIECVECGKITFQKGSSIQGAMENDCIEYYRLIKIDPPATGDSLPTRKEIENEMATN